MPSDAFFTVLEPLTYPLTGLAAGKTCHDGVHITGDEVTLSVVCFGSAAQAKVWKTEEHFVYFLFFILRQHRLMALPNCSEIP